MVVGSCVVLAIPNMTSAFFILCDCPREKGPFDAQISFFFIRASCLGLALSNDTISFSVARSVPALRTKIYGNVGMNGDILV